MDRNLPMSDLIDQYNENGFVHVSGFFSEEELQSVEVALADFIKNDAQSLTGRDINYTDGKINSIHALAKEGNFFWNLARRPKVLNLVGGLIGDEAVATVAEHFAKPAKVGLPSPMHQDNFYWCRTPAVGATLWIALDDCDHTNGGLAYFKGSHKLGTIDHKDSFAPGSSQTIADHELLRKMEKDYILVPLKRGDCLIHHVDTIHGSAANKSDRSRRGVTLQYVGKTTQIDQKMKTHYEARLYAQIRAREEAAAKAKAKE